MPVVHYEIITSLTFTGNVHAKTHIQLGQTTIRKYATVLGDIKLHVFLLHLDQVKAFASLLRLRS